MDWNSVVENVQKLPAFLLSALAVISFFWYLVSYRKVEELEQMILVKQAEYDNMEKTVHKKRGAISQGVLDAVTERDRKPVEQEINILKLKRQFILDKLPLVGYFKK